MRALREALASYRRHPLLCGLSIGAVALSLLILGVFGLVAHNVGGAITDVERRVEVVGYLLDDASPEQIQVVRRELLALPAVADVRYVSKDEALDSARRDLPELSNLYADLRVNPLPASLHLGLREGFRTPEAVAEVARGLAAYSFVEEARFGDDWVERLFALRRLAAVTAAVVGGGFAIVAALLVGTAVRTAILARGEEIEIMQIVGAREGYIQRPFLLEGAITGLAGGLIALGVLRAGYVLAQARFDVFGEIAWLPERWIVAGIGAASLLGLLAAVHSVHREVGRSYGL